MARPIHVALGFVLFVLLCFPFGLILVANRFDGVENIWWSSTTQEELKLTTVFVVGAVLLIWIDKFLAQKSVRKFVIPPLIVVGVLAGGIMAAVMLVGIFMPNSGTVGAPSQNSFSSSSGDFIKNSAYSAAKECVKTNWPRAKSFSPRSAPPVCVTNGVLYSVALVVDGVNAFNAPIRNVVLVTEVQSGDHWRMLNFEQQ